MYCQIFKDIQGKFRVGIFAKNKKLMFVSQIFDSTYRAEFCLLKINRLIASGVGIGKTKKLKGIFY